MIMLATVVNAEIIYTRFISSVEKAIFATAPVVTAVSIAIAAIMIL